MPLSNRSRRCRFFCPIDRSPCKLPFAGVVVKIRIREDRTFGRVDRIPTRTAALKNAAARSRPKRDAGDFPIERPVYSDHRSFADFEAKINILREQSFVCAHRRGGQAGD